MEELKHSDVAKKLREKWKFSMDVGPTVHVACKMTYITD